MWNPGGLPGSPYIILFVSSKILNTKESPFNFNSNLMNVEIIELIEKTAFSDTFRMRSKESGCEYSMKFSEGSSLKKYLTNEARVLRYILSSCKSKENVLRRHSIPVIHGSRIGSEEVTEGIYVPKTIRVPSWDFIITDLYSLSLQQILFHYKCISTTDAFQIVIQLIESVSFLHDMGIIHSNINPKNVKLSCGRRKRKFFLTDFAKSYFFTDPRSPNKDIERLKIGIIEESVNNNNISKNYMSILGHEGWSVNQQDEIESIGYILYEILLSTDNKEKENGINKKERSSLPWGKEIDNGRIMKMKVDFRECFRDELLQYGTGVVHFFEHIFSLQQRDCDPNKPKPINYSYLKGLLVRELEIRQVWKYRMPRYRFSWNDNNNKQQSNIFSEIEEIKVKGDMDSDFILSSCIPDDWKPFLFNNRRQFHQIRKKRLDEESCVLIISTLTFQKHKMVVNPENKTVFEIRKMLCSNREFMHWKHSTITYRGDELIDQYRLSEYNFRPGEVYNILVSLKSKKESERSYLKK